MNEDIVDIPISTTSTASGRRLKSIPTECKICGAPALYKYFGVISCQSCKVFFRRNANRELNTFKCHFRDSCEININNRHVCTSCRLAKCLSNGMQVEMIRCSISKNTMKHLPISTSTNEQNQLIPVRNLLRLDQSDLDINQWNLISNLIHCYEEHNSLAYVEQFLREQTSLPIKLRYKASSFNALSESILSGIERFFKLNNDFVSLCSDDRSILLRCAMENAGSFGSILVIRESQLFHNSDIVKSIETIYGSIVLNLTKRLLDEVDRDITFVKLGIAMFVFSTMNCANYTNIGLKNFQNIKDILRIQDIYAEVTWKYLLYKYDHQQSVKCFINFIRCLFIVNSAIIEVHQAEHYKRMVENLIEKMDQ